MSQSPRSLAQTDMEVEMFCQESDSKSSYKDYPSEDSVDPSADGPTEFCVVCGVSYEDQQEGCEFCESKLNEVSSNKMEED